MRPRRSAAAFIVLVLCRSAADVVPAVVDQAKRDATTLVTIDNPPSTTQAALGVALFAALVASDAHLSEQGQEHLPERLGRFTSGGSTGTPNLFAAALVAERLVFGDRRGTVGGLTLVEGNILLDLTLKVSKSAFGRFRPDRPDAGHWFSGGDSFPSSHTAHAFMIAAVLDATVDRPAWRWVFYPLASCVGLARIRQGDHFPSDVVAGGLLGWWIGHRLSIAHDLPDRRGTPRLAWVPVKGGGCIVASISM